MRKDLEHCEALLADAETILIGAGAGLTAAAGISYTDKERFAEIFPAWVERGFSMQYQLMGYSDWTESEKWGYYTTHLDYVYFSQGVNQLYQSLQELTDSKNRFVFTSNVDELFHKNGFDEACIYTPQGSYGRIQCERPCTAQSLWDITPFFEVMKKAIDPYEQVLTDQSAIPRCPNCGESMFINARVDASFIDSPYELERHVFEEWLRSIANTKVLLFELGAGYNTPGVVRLPMEALARKLPHATLVRVNLSHADIPVDLQSSGLSVEHDIANFVTALAG